MASLGLRPHVPERGAPFARLPTWCIIAFSPPPDCVETAPYVQELLQTPCLRLLSLLDSQLWGDGGQRRSTLRDITGSQAPPATIS